MFSCPGAGLARLHWGWLGLDGVWHGVAHPLVEALSWSVDVVRLAPLRESCGERAVGAVSAWLRRPCRPADGEQRHLAHHLSHFAFWARGGSFYDLAERLPDLSSAWQQIETGHSEQLAAELEIALPLAVRVKPVMPDALEARWNGMQQEAADELVGAERHYPLPLRIG